MVFPKMSFLDRIRECNVHDLSGFRPFLVGDQRLGWMRHRFAERLAPFAEVFQVSEAAVHLHPRLDSFDARSAAIAAVLRELSREGMLPGWRNEDYPVKTSFAAEPLFRMERSAVPHFGVRAYGVHMNGFVRRADGIHMWVGRRSFVKPTYPGMLDNMVAGGQPIGLSLKANLIKECDEEAAVPAELAQRAVPVSAITYCLEGEGGLKPNVQFCYDLELPDSFVPHNRDGEIHEFYLWPIGQVAETVRDTRQFKFNCNLVIIDFLIRHGLHSPEEPDYVELVQGLRR